MSTKLETKLLLHTCASELLQSGYINSTLPTTLKDWIAGRIIKILPEHFVKNLLEHLLYSSKNVSISGPGAHNQIGGIGSERNSYGSRGSRGSHGSANQGHAHAHVSGNQSGINYRSQNSSGQTTTTTNHDLNSSFEEETQTDHEFPAQTFEGSHGQGLLWKMLLQDSSDENGCESKRKRKSHVQTNKEQERDRDMVNSRFPTSLNFDYIRPNATTHSTINSASTSASNITVTGSSKKSFSAFQPINTGLVTPGVSDSHRDLGYRNEFGPPNQNMSNSLAPLPCIDKMNLNLDMAEINNLTSIKPMDPNELPPNANNSDMLDHSPIVSSHSHQIHHAHGGISQGQNQAQGQNQLLNSNIQVNELSDTDHHLTMNNENHNVNVNANLNQINNQTDLELTALTDEMQQDDLFMTENPGRVGHDSPIPTVSLHYAPIDNTLGQESIDDPRLTPDMSNSLIGYNGKNEIPLPNSNINVTLGPSRNPLNADGQGQGQGPGQTQTQNTNQQSCSPNKPQETTGQNGAPLPSLLDNLQEHFNLEASCKLEKLSDEQLEIDSRNALNRSSPLPTLYPAINTSNSNIAAITSISKTLPKAASASTAAAVAVTSAASKIFSNQLTNKHERSLSASNANSIVTQLLPLTQNSPALTSTSILPNVTCNFENLPSNLPQIMNIQTGIQNVPVGPAQLPISSGISQAQAQNANLNINANLSSPAGPATKKQRRNSKPPGSFNELTIPLEFVKKNIPTFPDGSRMCNLCGKTWLPKKYVMNNTKARQHLASTHRQEYDNWLKENPELATVKKDEALGLGNSNLSMITGANTGRSWIDVRSSLKNPYGKDIFWSKSSIFGQNFGF